MFPSKTAILSGGAGLVNQYSLAFDGSDDKVDLGSDKPNDGTGAITISAWINPTTFGEGSRGYIITNGKMFLYVNDSDDKLTLSRDDENEYHSADDSISTGSWQHIAVASASDGTNTNFYVNGALSGNANQNVGTPAVGNTNTFIGNNNGGNRTFHGNIDEVSIWNTALSAGDISALYNSGVPTDLLSDSNSGNLVGWWRMGDGDTFPTITDNSTNSNDGTMTNMDAVDIVKDTP